ncbi:MAG: helix-turn-helix transcriptional regulator [Eubacteriales bacterium]
MDNAKIGMFINSRRKELGMTQQELADKLQITNRAVSKWEKGDGLPDISMLEPLAVELAVTVDEILYGEAIQKDDVLLEVLKTNEAPQPSKKVFVTVLISLIITVTFSYSGILRAASNISRFITLASYRPTGLLVALTCLADTVFWCCISIITYCSICRLFGYKTPSNRKVSIVALIFGIGLVLLSGSGYLQIDMPFFTLFLGLCAVLSVYHGYKTPFLVFYSLSFLSVVVGYGIEISRLISFGLQNDLQVYSLSNDIIYSVVSVFFLIIYGLSVKATAKRKEIIAD